MGFFSKISQKVAPGSFAARKPRLHEQTRAALTASKAARKAKGPVLPSEKDLAQVAREAGL